jgi:hypothetical protein
MFHAILIAVMLAGPADVPLPPPPAVGGGGGTLLVAIPTARIVGDVPQRVQAAFEQALVAEVRKLDGVAALGANEIGDVLSSAAEGRMRGCTQDEACLLEVASAIGLNEILTSEIVLKGNEYSMVFRRLSAKTGKAVGSDTRQATKGNGEELLRAVGPVVQSLYTDRKLRADASRGVDSATLHRLNPPPLPRWVFAATATAAVTSLAAGATFGVLAQQSKKDLQNLINQSQSQVVPGSELKTLQDRLNTNAQMANLFLGIGAGLAVAATVEAFFTDWHDYRSQVIVVPSSKGTTVAAVWQF